MTCELATKENMYPMPDTLDGYCCVKVDTIWLSAVISKQPRKGNFSRFLDKVENEFKTIKVPTPTPLMVKILSKRGYKLVEGWFPEPFNEMGQIMIKSK